MICYKNEDSPLFETAKTLIRKLVTHSYQICLSPLVLDEFLHPLKFLLQKRKTKRLYATLRKALEDILCLPNLEIVNPPLEKTAQLKVISLMKQLKLQPRDAYHLLTIQANKIRFFATLDNDFKIAFQKKTVLKIQSALI